MGFKGGNILEPSCGIGNFLGVLPESMAGSRFYGVELDKISGSIARQLYQKENIHIGGFEDADLPDSFFDVAVGNVPFGDFKVSDKRYDRHKWLIHDYFFGKALDKVRAGGVIAFVTSKGTMDKRSFGQKISRSACRAPRRSEDTKRYFLEKCRNRSDIGHHFPAEKRTADHTGA